MDVVNVSGCGVSQDGRIRSGIVEFSDGKTWQFTSGRKIYFTIDSGIPSNESFGNFGRIIAPLKRVDALLFWLRTHCHKCRKDMPQNEAACLHCGKLRNKN